MRLKNIYHCFLKSDGPVVYALKIPSTILLIFMYVHVLDFFFIVIVRFENNLVTLWQLTKYVKDYFDYTCGKRGD